MSSDGALLPSLTRSRHFGIVSRMPTLAPERPVCRPVNQIHSDISPA
jgi:hypothetical protein